MPIPVEIQAYVDANLITLDRAIHLNDTETKNFQAPYVRELIDAGTITVDAALQLDGHRRNALANQDIRQRVTAGTLNLGLVHIPFVQAYVDANLITLDRAIHLNDTETKNFQAPYVRELIDAGTITVDAALQLDWDKRNALANQDIRQRVTAGTLNLGLVHIPFVQAYVDANRITLDRAIHLNYTEIENLQVSRGLIDVGIITVEQARVINENQRDALRNEQTRQRLIHGELTIENIIGDPVPHHVHGVAAVVPNINDGQSTHNASVHQAVSESATRLAQRYQLMIDGAGLEIVIERVKAYVSNLSDDSQKNKAAKRCVLRIAAPNYTFTDPSSHITTRQLLALTFLAICDDAHRMASLDDAKAQFVEGLYEIQRGYNLSDTGVDRGGEDRPICSAGTFNKLIEKLQGIHPDGQIRFITRETASLKLPIVVRETVRTYLLSLPERHPKWDVTEIAPLISALQ